ncbi:Cytochrome P450 709B2 [Linum perenne]
MIAPAREWRRFLSRICAATIAASPSRSTSIKERASHHRNASLEAKASIVNGSAKCGSDRPPAKRTSPVSSRKINLRQGQNRPNHPQLLLNSLEVMINRMTSCTLQMISEWPSTSSSSEIELNSEFKKLTADIIAHTCFGTSYLEGIQVFESMKHLQTRSAASLTNVFIPGTQYLPTLSNLEIWKLDRELNNSLRSIVQNRRLRSNSGNNGYGDDLLGVMIDAKLKMKEIMGECRSFFFSGHQTTSNLLTWAVFLLSVHQEWQEILREEMNMVLLETLRLYSPALEAFRTTTQDMKLGNLDIPKGTSLFIPIIMIHRSRQLWGHDSNEFKPTRFENGVSMAANHPNAFLSFGIGPRVCIGQNFAMMQAKSVLAMILQRFSFTLSSGVKKVTGEEVSSSSSSRSIKNRLSTREVIASWGASDRNLCDQSSG